MEKKIDTLYKVRHSLAHLLAIAILEIDPKAKLAIGPVIDTGFYYDFELSSGTDLSDASLKKITKRMKHLIKTNIEFSGEELTGGEALKRWKDQPYKTELINDLVSDGEKITAFTSGEFIDLCAGGHVDSTKDIDPDCFVLDRVAGAYWRGDENNTMLTRIYGLAFENKGQLDTFIEQREEARKRDHKKLGRELDLFYVDDLIGKGLPMWTPKGTAIKLALEEFTRDLERKYDYDHVSTPYLGNERLYETSGHLAHYKDDMYAPIDMDGERFYLRPMACPHHIRLLMRKPISYRDLPVRYAELADYNRYEKSGELMGMIRVRKFQLTDGHIFVTPEQLKDEFKRVCLMIQEGMKGLGLLDIVSYRFSKRDPANKEKYYPDDKLWDEAEAQMKEALDELGFEYTEASDEAAFYGPKLDVQAKNVNGKEDTLFTAQMDFLLPEKFSIEYTDEDGTKKRPVMIHRSAIGCLERTFAFLIEHYGGNFPLWLAPLQVKVLPISDKHADFAETVFTLLKEAGIRTQLDRQAESLGKKIRQTKLEKVPYFLVIGDNEVDEGTVTLESRDEGKIGSFSPDKLLERLNKEIKNRS